MVAEKFNLVVEAQDQYDTVTYNSGKIKRYFNPNTDTYRVWEGKTKVLWQDIDYHALMDNVNADVGKLVLLLRYLHNKNYLITKQKTPVFNNKQIAELLNSNISNSSTRIFIKKLYDKQIIRKDNITKRIYINPVVSMKTCWLDINCYRIFRDEMLPVLTPRQIKNLDKHVLESFGTLKNE